MIDTSKQWTYNGKQVRIYADGSDTFTKSIHAAYRAEEGWRLVSLDESDLVKVWEPKLNDWCYFWDSLQHGCHVRKFAKHAKEGYVDSSNIYWIFCAQFKGELPDAFSINKDNN